MAKRAELVILMLNLSDFTRMDGSLNARAREAERLLHEAAFCEEDVAYVLAWFENHINLTVYAGNIRYESGTARNSGDPETSFANTWINALIVYMSFRSREGGGKAPKEAYAALGIYLGDDGATPDLCERAHRKFSKVFGITLKYDGVAPGDQGATFLARYYSGDVFKGDTNSMCDIKRQMLKWHLTGSLPAGVTKLQRAAEKVSAFLLTDRFTPVIGDYCRRFEELAPKLLSKCDIDTRVYWNARDGLEDQYPNAYAPWMLEHLETAMPEFRLIQFRRELANATHVDQLLKLSLCWEKPDDTPLEGALIDREKPDVGAPAQAPTTKQTDAPFVVVRSKAQKRKEKKVRRQERDAASKNPRVETAGSDASTLEEAQSSPPALPPKPTRASTPESTPWLNRWRKLAEVGLKTDKDAERADRAVSASS